MPKNTAKGGGWVTINGVHVFIEGGKITKGPAKFIGSSVNDLPSGKSAEDKKAELKAKYGATKKSVVESEKTEEAKKTEKPMTMGDYFRQQNKLTGRTEPIKRGVSAQKSVAKETPAEAKKADNAKSTKSNTSKEVDLGLNTDFSQLTKAEINRGIKQLEKQYNSGDPYLTDAIDRIIFKAEDALASGNFKTKATKSATPSTGNTNFDNAKSTTKSTAKNPNKAKSNPIGEPGLQVAHYDSAKGGRNVYTAVYPDGSTKKLTASQAKEMFPNDPLAQRIKTRTSTRASSATPSAQANFNSAVQSAQNKGTGSKNEKAMQKKYGKAFGMGNW